MDGTRIGVILRQMQSPSSSAPDGMWAALSRTKSGNLTRRIKSKSTDFTDFCFRMSRDTICPPEYFLGFWLILAFAEPAQVLETAMCKHQTILQERQCADGATGSEEFIAICALDEVYDLSGRRVFSVESACKHRGSEAENALTTMQNEELRFAQASLFSARAAKQALHTCA